ncbi:MAG: AtpZ/AtpI family protein [Thermomicrobiaceae bacterium]|nr:AtpZ/AtpI family protein [Thermomicrobiaceae bacterium]
MRAPDENPLGNLRDWRAVGEATGLGCSVVASLILFIGGGVLLDNWIGTLPIFTLVGVVLGLVTAGYLLYELAVSAGSARRRTRPSAREDAERRLEPDEQEQ